MKRKSESQSKVLQEDANQTCSGLRLASEPHPRPLSRLERGDWWRMVVVRCCIYPYLSPCEAYHGKGTRGEQMFEHLFEHRNRGKAYLAQS